MITKYKKMGTELSQKEMKEIMGGNTFTNFLWDCTNGVDHQDYCSATPDVPDCETCTPKGTCSLTTVCMF